MRLASPTNLAKVCRTSATLVRSPNNSNATCTERTLLNCNATNGLITESGRFSKISSSPKTGRPFVVTSGPGGAGGLDAYLVIPPSCEEGITPDHPTHTSTHTHTDTHRHTHTHTHMHAHVHVHKHKHKHKHASDEPFRDNKKHTDKPKESPQVYCMVNQVLDAARQRSRYTLHHVNLTVLYCIGSFVELCPACSAQLQRQSSRTADRNGHHLLLSLEVLVQRMTSPGSRQSPDTTC